MNQQITKLAERIKVRGETSVSLTASSVTMKSARRATIVSNRRVQVVEHYLVTLLRQLHESSVKVTATGSAGVSDVSSGASANVRTISGRVIARIS